MEQELETVFEPAIESLFAGLAGGAIIGFIITMIAIFFILMIGVYVYSSFAYMRIAQKAKHPSPGIAWIPIVGKPLVCVQISKMDWRPMLLLLGSFVFVFPYIGPFLAWGCWIAFSVFFYIWRWKTYEVVKHPGWYSLMFLLPVVGYVFLGIVAWSKEDEIEKIKKKQ